MEDVESPQAERSSLHRRIVTRVLLLLVTAVSLYLLFPSLVEVFSSWRSLGRLDPWWAGVAVLAEIVSFIAVWELMRIALGTRRWFVVAASQLAGNAFGRIVPGGLAAAGGLQLQMLRTSGAAGPRAAAALGAASALQLGTLFALPLLSLPAIVGGAPVNHSLLSALWLGGIALVVLTAGIVAAFAFDRPLALAGKGVQWTLNHLPRRRRRTEELPRKLLAERDFIAETLGKQLPRAVAAATGKSVFDYGVLLCCLRALGVHPRPSLVLLAYVAASILTMIPLTPGGLGFVEAGLVGTLALAGVSGGDAIVATLAYRLISFWLPIPVGGGAYWLFRRRYS